MAKSNQTAQQTETSAPATPDINTEDKLELFEQFKTKSAVIRELARRGYKRGPIAKFLGIRYQHVRNVLVAPVKKTS